MSKFVKGMLMDELRSRLGDTTELLVVDCSRLDAITTNTWRLALREKEIGVLAVKNTLARRVLEERGVTGMEDVLKGPSTIVWGGEDIVALSKEISKWAKELGELEVKGGTVDGQALDAAAVDKLSKSPGRLELISMIAGQIAAPGANLAAAMLSPGKKLASQIEKIGEGGEE